MRLAGATEAMLVNAIEDLLIPATAERSKYSLWSNVKCPHCHIEFPYRFRGNLALRLSDFSVVLVDGCQLDTDEGVFAVRVSR